MRDRRFEFRELLNEKAVLQWEEPTGLKQCIGKVCDLSVAGARIELDQPIRLRTAVAVKIRGQELRGTVQYCTRARSKHLLGLEFRIESRGVVKPNL